MGTSCEPTATSIRMVFSACIVLVTIYRSLHSPVLDAKSLVSLRTTSSDIMGPFLRAIRFLDIGSRLTAAW